MHEHKECDHELKYCKHCGVVYCEKCKTEWGAKKATFQSLQDYWNSYPKFGPPYGGTSKQIEVSYTTNSSSGHKHAVSE